MSAKREPSSQFVRYESRCANGHLSTSTPGSRPNVIEWLAEDFDALGCGTTSCSKRLGTITRVEGLGACQSREVVYDARDSMEHPIHAAINQADKGSDHA